MQKWGKHAKSSHHALLTSSKIIPEWTSTRVFSRIFQQHFGCVSVWQCTQPSPWTNTLFTVLSVPPRDRLSSLISYRLPHVCFSARVNVTSIVSFGLPVVLGQIFGGLERSKNNITMILGFGSMQNDRDVCNLGCHCGDWRSTTVLIYLSFQMAAKARSPLYVCVDGWTCVCTWDLRV